MHSDSHGTYPKTIALAQILEQDRSHSMAMQRKITTNAKVNMKVKA
jgi:hypothetical protein